MPQKSIFVNAVLSKLGVQRDPEILKDALKSTKFELLEKYEGQPGNLHFAVVLNSRTMNPSNSLLEIGLIDGVLRRLGVNKDQSEVEEAIASVQSHWSDIAIRLTIS